MDQEKLSPVQRREWIMNRWLNWFGTAMGFVLVYGLLTGVFSTITDAIGPDDMVN
jgi:hypothetical protein